MRKVIKVFISTLLVAVMLTSCGDSGKLKKELDKITVTTVFNVPGTGYTSLEEITEEVYVQQMMLCEAYCETYEKTGYGLFENRFPDITRAKLMAELNDVRNDLNNECTGVFAETLMLILSEVTDCQNKQTYIVKRRNEVLEFYPDYKQFLIQKGDVSGARSKILLKYYEKNNEFAVSFLQRHKDDFIAAGVETIKSNAEKTDDLRTYVMENNKIIKALNGLFGGTTKEVANEVNAANRKLAERILDTMGELTEEEKEAKLREIDGRSDENNQ